MHQKLLPFFALDALCSSLVEFHKFAEVKRREAWQRIQQGFLAKKEMPMTSQRYCSKHVGFFVGEVRFHVCKQLT